MRVAVCYNQTPEHSGHGEPRDRIADAGSQDEAKAVVEALQQLDHQAVLVPLAADLGDFIQRLQTHAPDVIFNLCEGFWGNSRQEMNIAGVFELLGLPFTGSPALTLGLTQDKVRTKSLLLQKGLATPAFRLALPGAKLPKFDGLHFPLIVKPAREDASQGIEAASVVDNLKALTERIDYIHKTYQQPALVEEFIVGRELNITVLGDEKLKVLPVAEITFAASLPRPLVCFDSKWTPDSDAYKGTKPVCPARLSSREQLLVSMIAMRAARLLGCRDYARVDIRLRKFTPYILEINANPDISPAAGVARAAAADGLSYPRLIKHILESALKRKELPHARVATA